jgi:hypothetical protein
VRGERTREVTGRHRVESINGDGSSKRRRRRIDSTAHAWIRASHGGARHRPKGVAAMASGGGR